MVNALLNFTLQVALLLLVFWVALALLGLKWPFLKQVRRGYSNIVKSVLIAAATWLWVSPQGEQEGIGQVAQSHLEYDDEPYDNEEDSWV